MAKTKGKTLKKTAIAKKRKTPRNKNPKKNGRPLFEIDWKQVNEMCAIQCTQPEISAVLGCHRDTIDAACKRKFDLSFSKYFKEKSQVGQASLRHMQFQTANDGSVPMLIHLGKNILGQTDKKELSGGLNISTSAADLTDDELASIITEDADTE